VHFLGLAKNRAQFLGEEPDAGFMNDAVVSRNPMDVDTAGSQRSPAEFGVVFIPCRLFLRPEEG
jgi:hypothetical protein